MQIRGIYKKKSITERVDETELTDKKKSSVNDHFCLCKTEKQHFEERRQN